MADKNNNFMVWEAIPAFAGIAILTTKFVENLEKEFLNNAS